MILILCCLKPIHLIIWKAFILIYCKCNEVKPFEHSIPAAFHFLFHMLLKHIKWCVTDSFNFYDILQGKKSLRTYSFGDSLLGGSRLTLIPRYQWSRNQYLFITSDFVQYTDFDFTGISLVNVLFYCYYLKSSNYNTYRFEHLVFQFPDPLETQQFGHLYAWPDIDISLTNFNLLLWQRFFIHKVLTMGFRLWTYPLLFLRKACWALLPDLSWKFSSV